METQEQRALRQELLDEERLHAVEYQVVGDLGKHTTEWEQSSKLQSEEMEGAAAAQPLQMLACAMPQRPWQPRQPLKSKQIFSLFVVSGACTCAPGGPAVSSTDIAWARPASAWATSVKPNVSPSVIVCPAYSYVQ